MKKHPCRLLLALLVMLPVGQSSAANGVRDCPHVPGVFALWQAAALLQ